MTTRSRLAGVLRDIEAEMRRMGMWSAQPPSSQNLSSQQPFCVDTLDVEQWLQWIFIPRMEHILERDEPLPRHSGVYVYAYQCLSTRDPPPTRLLELIEEFDHLISTANT